MLARAAPSARKAGRELDSKPPFDSYRVGVWLVVGVVVVQAVIVLLGAGICIWYADRVTSGMHECDPNNKLASLLASALAAALALMGRKKDP